MKKILFTSCLLVTLSPCVEASDVDPLLNDMPVVLTPARLRQSLADVPASVTIITSEMMQRFGITSLPDALRLVPGMAITQASGNDYRINYHGTNSLVPKRMDVLIDGISVYRPALASVDWASLPVTIEDIKRIEVTRSPNSAAYGPNSMLAVVNIITKAPDDVGDMTLQARGGSISTAEGFARYAGKVGTSTQYRVSVGRQMDRGFDSSTFGPVAHNATRLNRFNLQTITELSPTESINLQALLVHGTNEAPYADRFQRSLPDKRISSSYLNGVWQKNVSPTHEVQIQANVSNHRLQQEWETCPLTGMYLPQLGDLWKSNPGYVNTILGGRVPSGGSPKDDALARAALSAIRALGPRATVPMCATANQNYSERRVDLEFQDIYVFSDALRMVNGIGARQDIGDSQTFLAGREKNTSYRAFSNIEYRPIKLASVNFGGFVEKDQLSGTAFSPRLALNMNISDGQTLRFIVSKGNRTPNILEQRANISYTGDLPQALNGQTRGSFYQHAYASGTLESEKILSREIGYLGNFWRQGLLIDAKIFDDSLTNLISEKMQLSSFAPTNNNSARLRGAEIQANYAPNANWHAFLHYAFLNNEASTVLEQTQYAKHMGAVGISRRLGNGMTVSLATYQSGANGPSQSTYGREDLVISKEMIWGRQNVLISLTARHLDNLSVQYIQDIGQTVTNRYESPMQYFLAMKFNY